MRNSPVNTSKVFFIYLECAKIDMIKILDLEDEIIFHAISQFKNHFIKKTPGAGFEVNKKVTS